MNTIVPAATPVEPVATPAESTPTNGAAAPSSETVDSFSGFDDDFDSIDLGAASEPSPEPLVPPASAEPTTAQPETKPPPVTPPVAEAQPVAPPSPKEPAASAPPPSEITSAIEGMTTNGDAIINHLASTTFALSKEEADAFELNAVEMVPKLMARVHHQATMNTLSLIQKMVPNIVSQLVDKQVSGKEKAKEAISEFYSTNSDLNAKDHGALVQKWAQAFRTQNPSAPRSEAIKFVGQAIRTELGIPALVPGARPQARPQAFAPAVPGARHPTVQIVDAPFAALGELDLDE